jgi:predicted enzyme related to lactoylglutathione lyase
MEPAVADGTVRRLALIPVAEHDLRCPANDLADVAGGDFLADAVDDAQFDPGHCLAAGLEPFRVAGIVYLGAEIGDVAAALRFYGQLFGWSKGVGHDMGAMGVYQLFEHGGAGVGGICNTQGPSTPPSWLSYVHVADANRAVASAKAAGGRLLHGPIEVPGGSWIALFLDPQGGAFAVQEAPRTVSAPKPAATSKATPATAPAKPLAAKAAAKAAKPAKAAKKKAAPKKKAAKKKVARKKAKAAKRKVAPRKTARKSARRAAPKKRARAKRGRRR